MKRTWVRTVVTVAIILVGGVLGVIAVFLLAERDERRPWRVLRPFVIAVAVFGGCILTLLICIALNSTTILDSSDAGGFLRSVGIESDLLPPLSGGGTVYYNANLLDKRINFIYVYGRLVPAERELMRERCPVLGPEGGILALSIHDKQIPAEVITALLLKRRDYGYYWTLTLNGERTQAISLGFNSGSWVCAMDIMLPNGNYIMRFFRPVR